MSSNIFQVISESNLDEILNNNSQTIVVVMFSSKKCPPCMSIKPKFVALAKSHQDCFFVYIDLTNFKETTGKYTKEVKFTPMFVYFYDNYPVADVAGPEEDLIRDALIHLKNTINQMKKDEMEKQAYLKQKQLEQMQQAQQMQQMQQSQQMQQMQQMQQVHQAQQAQQVHQTQQVHQPQQVHQSHQMQQMQPVQPVQHALVHNNNNNNNNNNNIPCSMQSNVSSGIQTNINGGDCKLQNKSMNKQIVCNDNVCTIQNIQSDQNLQNLSNDSNSTNQNVSCSTINTNEDKYLMKINMLRKLYHLAKSGVKLTSTYTINSNYDDMEFEYNLHTNPEALVVSSINTDVENKKPGTDISHSNSETHCETNCETNCEIKAQTETESEKKKELTIEELEKQEQLRKIQKINQLNEIMQLQQLIKAQHIEHLKKIKKEKELEEKEKEINKNKKSSDNEEDF